MWILVFAVSIYLGGLVTLYRESNSMNPHWNLRRWKHFIRTFWYWPVWAGLIIGVIIWEYFRYYVLGQRDYLRDEHDEPPRS